MRHSRGLSRLYLLCQVWGFDLRPACVEVEGLLMFIDEGLLLQNPVRRAGIQKEPLSAISIGAVFVGCNPGLPESKRAARIRTLISLFPFPSEVDDLPPNVPHDAVPGLNFD